MALYRTKQQCICITEVAIHYPTDFLVPHPPLGIVDTLFEKMWVLFGTSLLPEQSTHVVVPPATPHHC